MKKDRLDLLGIFWSVMVMAIFFVGLVVVLVSGVPADRSTRESDFAMFLIFAISVIGGVVPACTCSYRNRQFHSIFGVRPRYFFWAPKFVGSHEKELLQLQPQIKATLCKLARAMHAAFAEQKRLLEMRATSNEIRTATRAAADAKSAFWSAHRAARVKQFVVYKRYRGYLLDVNAFDTTVTDQEISLSWFSRLIPRVHSQYSSDLCNLWDRC